MARKVEKHHHEHMRKKKEAEQENVEKRLIHIYASSTYTQMARKVEKHHHEPMRKKKEAEQEKRTNQEREMLIMAGQLPGHSDGDDERNIEQAPPSPPRPPSIRTVRTNVGVCARVRACTCIYLCMYTQIY